MLPIKVIICSILEQQSLELFFYYWSPNDQVFFNYKYVLITIVLVLSTVCVE